jgi:hypothetical protein
MLGSLTHVYKVKAINDAQEWQNHAAAIFLLHFMKGN